MALLEVKSLRQRRILFKNSMGKRSKSYCWKENQQLICFETGEFSWTETAQDSDDEYSSEFRDVYVNSEEHLKEKLIETFSCEDLERVGIIDAVTCSNFKESKKLEREEVAKRHRRSQYLLLQREFDADFAQEMENLSLKVRGLEALLGDSRLQEFLVEVSQRAKTLASTRSSSIKKGDSREKTSLEHFTFINTLLTRCLGAAVENKDLSSLKNLLIEAAAEITYWESLVTPK